MIFVIWLLFAIFLALFALFFPVYYISELVLSFLPYMLVIGFVWFVMSLILLRNKRLKKFKNGKYILILPIFVLLFGLLFFLTSRQYNDFYTGEWFEDKNTSITWENANLGGWLEEGIDILYSNILYTNDDYEGLQQMIKDRNPDMVFMVEFTDDHNENLQEILKIEYPYSARTTWSKKYFGGVVFSKRPVKNLTHAVDQWAWRYSYFNTEYNGDNYYIYLVHTSSPITQRYFDMRNKQLGILSQDFAEHQVDRSENDKILMMWDFNVSPWSKYYKDFANMMTWLDNTTNKFSAMFTWNISFLPFVQSHIDHIFVSENVIIWNIEKVNTPWSDHRGFFIENVR